MSAKEINKKFSLTQVSIRLVREKKIMSSNPITQPEDGVSVCAQILAEYDREAICVLNLQQDGRPINFNIAHIGALTSSLGSPREIMKSAILSNAASIIILHNHPSGNMTPSKEDVALTNRMIEVGNLLGIPVLDHIITSPEGKFLSMRESGYCDF